MNIRHALVLLSALATLLSSACDPPAGACAGCSDLLDNCYCYEDWDASECADYDDQEVNGASWTHYPLQTCEEAGFAATL